MTPNQKYINKSIYLALFNNVLPSKFLGSVLKHTSDYKDNHLMPFNQLNF